jgi:arylsulfatase A-like enzyme
MDTHGPYEPPGEFAMLYRDGRVSDRDAQSLYQQAIRDPESITDEERELLIDLYDAEIRYNDEKIGEFFDELRSRDLLDKSLLMFTADHGDAFGEHGYYEHPRYLHDEITHVPLLVRPPSGAEERISTPVSTLDIASTIASVIGRDIGSNRDSLLDAALGERPVFLQARGEKDQSHIRRYAARTDNGSCFCERDLETGSITFDECSGRGLRSELEAHVEARIRVETGEDTADDGEVDEEIERRLTALGYKE